MLAGLFYLFTWIHQIPLKVQKLIFFNDPYIWVFLIGIDCFITLAFSLYQCFCVFISSRLNYFKWGIKQIGSKSFLTFGFGLTFPNSPCVLYRSWNSLFPNELPGKLESGLGLR